MAIPIPLDDCNRLDELEAEPKLKLDNTCLLGLLVGFESPNKRVVYL